MMSLLMRPSWVVTSASSLTAETYILFASYIPASESRVCKAALHRIEEADLVLVTHRAVGVSFHVEPHRVGVQHLDRSFEVGLILHEKNDGLSLVWTEPSWYVGMVVQA